MAGWNQKAGEQRKSAKELFNDALELPAGERLAFVAGICGNDARLRARVLHLLSVYESDSGFLGAATVDPDGRDAMAGNGDATEPPDTGLIRLLRDAADPNFVASTADPVGGELEAPG